MLIVADVLTTTIGWLKILAHALSCHSCDPNTTFFHIDVWLF